MPTEHTWLKLLFYIAGGTAGIWTFYFKVIKKGLQKARSGLQFAEIAYRELVPGSGQSLREANDRTEIKVDIVMAMIHEMMDRGPTPYFRANDHGELVWANKAYTRLLERDMAELYVHGWITAIHPGDRENVVVEWKEAVRQKRIFSMKFRCIAESGKEHTILYTASPILSNGGLAGYVGHIDVLA